MTANEPSSEQNLDGYEAPPIAWTGCVNASTRV